MSIHKTPKPPQTLAAIIRCTDLLDARCAAIEHCVKECGGEKNSDDTTDVTRVLLVLLAREAAGQGFDAGVRYMTSKAKLSGGEKTKA